MPQFVASCINIVNSASRSMNDDSRVMLQIVASLIITIYDHMFIILVTGNLIYNLKLSYHSQHKTSNRRQIYIPPYIITSVDDMSVIT